ncbi:effector-associated constant component EACC1 [Allorhizocola rhizosphaerae]|uniref:effector-associated constant component EACC1 n=1 Tax=Allorhizocola rhizosphaerae TaxID=1872709 RepID=UPI000E3DB4C5|nr:hypothetical protein [Allorhizocola rhizosphaerae]
MNKTSSLQLLIRCPDMDDSGVADLTRRLRRELIDSGVDDVSPLHNAEPAPQGAKSGEALALGALAVSIAPIAATALFDIIASWLQRQPTDVEIEIGGNRISGRVTREQRDALVQAFLDQTRSGA